MIAICIPISESKCYSFNDIARGIFELDYPKDQIYIIFSLDDFGAKEVDAKIAKFIDNWPIKENCFVVTTTFSGNNPSSSDIIPWKTRAKFAADLRNLYTHFVNDNLPDVEYIFSVGSDIVLYCDSLQMLLDMDVKLASGLYVSRIQHRPLSLSYINGNWSYNEVDCSSKEPFMADWSGLDCALIHRDIFSKVNWDNFSVDKYGVGEDGYFYLEAKALGYALSIHPGVQPLHIQDDGKAISAGEVPVFGLKVVCPECGWQTKMGKTWKDITIKCPCGKLLDLDPFDKPRNLDNTAIGAGLSNKSIK
jgi:hypothetical protein